MADNKLRRKAFERIGDASKRAYRDGVRSARKNVKSSSQAVRGVARTQGDAAGPSDA